MGGSGPTTDLMMAWVIPVRRSRAALRQHWTYNLYLGPSPGLPGTVLMRTSENSRGRQPYTETLTLQNLHPLSS